MNILLSFLDRIKLAIEDDTFVKISLGNYKGSDVTLKNIYAKLVIIKREKMISFTFRHKTKDITKNMSIVDGLDFLAQQINLQNFRASTLFMIGENVFFQFNNKGIPFVKNEKVDTNKVSSLSHDHKKERKIEGDYKQYLHDLRLTDDKGQVYKNAQDKWKQINHYIELLSSELSILPKKDQYHVADMGAGKGYLTFALYDYLNHVLKQKSVVQGIEYRDDLVKLCNEIAQSSQFNNLSFTQGTIENFEPNHDLDILIALHACDTATDDAIFKGIHYNAELIVVAPCCHKQIRREIERNKPKNDLDFLTKHGIFLERHAEMLTDGIRSLVLEYYGYQTKVMQFISDAHTAKNVMIVAVKKKVNQQKQDEILEKLRSLKNYFGIEKHYLEKLCQI